MSTKPKFHAGDIDGVELVQVIKILFTRGSGVDGDPVRQVIHYWTMEGNFLGERAYGVLGMPMWAEKGKG